MLAWRSPFRPTRSNAISACTSRNLVGERNRKTAMKTSRVCKTVSVITVLFGSLFHTDPTSAEGCPSPSFAAARTFDVGAEGRPFCVAVGDFNGDGKLDLAVANYGCPACPLPVNGSVSILLG
ncbi:MAG: hypothetical protein DME19_01670, partial [Verrucomicrobia bacterium]